MGSDVKSHTSPPVHTEHKTAAARLSRCHAQCCRASHRFLLCLTARDYFQLKIMYSKVLEELVGFPTPRRSADFLCQFKVILGNELALVQTTGTLMGYLTLPALLMAASGAKCQYTLRSQTQSAFIWEKKTYQHCQIIQEEICNPGWHNESFCKACFSCAKYVGA